MGPFCHPCSVSLTDSNKFSKVMDTLKKNRDVKDLATLASGKISEEIQNKDDKKVVNIIKQLDKKYLQTRSERFEVLVRQIKEFKIGSDESAEMSWERFSSLRKSLLKEK